MYRNFDEIRAAFAFCALSLRLLAWEVPASRGREHSSGDPGPDDASLSSDPITSSEWSYTADRMMLPRCRKVALIKETFDCNSKEEKVENPKWIARRGGGLEGVPTAFGDPPGCTAILAPCQRRAASRSVRGGPIRCSGASHGCCQLRNHWMP